MKFGDFFPCIDPAGAGVILFFVLHLLLMAIAIGTPLIALFLRLSTRETPPHRLAKKLISPYLTVKTFGVGCGIVLLLIVSALQPIGITTPAASMGGWFAAAIGMAAAAFFLLHLVQKGKIAPPLEPLAILLLLAATALFCLLGTLTGEVGGGGIFSLSRGKIALQWLPRFLHLLGAAIIAAALFHHRFTASDDGERKTLKEMMFAGMAWQIASGISLYASFVQSSLPLPSAAILLGALIAAAIIWLLHNGRNPSLTSMAVPLIFALMLSARDQARRVPLPAAYNPLVTTQGTILMQRVALNTTSAAFDPPSTVSDSASIFKRACVGCHGADGEGPGDYAGGLEVPPEELRAMRTTRNYLYRVIKEGVPGSAMPSFATMDKNQLLKIVDHLEENYRVLSLPENVSLALSASEQEEAEKVYHSLCARCHGDDGSGWEFSDNFRPTLPDFRHYSLAPKRAMEIIANGYKGTAMPPFNNLSVRVRWGLVKVIQMKRET